MTASMEASNSSPESTADAEEIARFAAIADTWWDATGKFRPLHKLNPTRIEFIRDHVAAHFGRDITTDRPFDGLTFLDVGCGGGLVCEPLCRLGGTVTGIDAAEESLGVARHHAEQGGLDINYRRALPEEILEEGNQFDVIINMEVVEHVTDMDVFLDICGQLVKPGGVMAASTINRTLKSLALAKIGAEYILRWVPAGTHDWRKFVKPSELAQGLRLPGVEFQDIKGMSYSPITDEWCLSSDLDVNYLVFATKT
jgi:2-polyprenyl-6-hydroxyphenyl methylase / 3-demethylubiquinone-9 3-methyltransferase